MTSTDRRSARRATGIVMFPRPPADHSRLHWRLVVVAACGLVVQAVGYAAGWSGHVGRAVALWDVGMVVLVAPFGWAMLRPARTDLGRLLLGLALALGLYLSWVLASPVMAAHFDESLHVANLVMLLRDGFFQHNDKLVVGPFFPGLELVTVTIHWFTGLPLMACQILTAMLGRTVFVLALFGLVKLVTKSGRVAGLALVLYAGSQHFYYYNAQYHYQLQALALLAAALYLLQRIFAVDRGRAALFWRAVAVVAALAVTHHLTSWLLDIGLAAVSLLYLLGRDREKAKVAGALAAVSTLLSAAWSYVVGPRLVQYLEPVLGTAGVKMMEVLEGQSQGRVIGQSASGDKAPIWELGAMGGSALLWVLLLIPSCWWAWRRGSLGRRPVRYAVLCLAAAYPFLFLARFNAQSGEVADRISTFVFIAMSVVVGVWLLPRLRRFRYVVVPALVVIVIGGAILGAGPGWRRVPGPYLAGADQRSIDRESLAIADWVSRYVPPGSVIATDSSMEAFLPTIADVGLDSPQAGTPGAGDMFYAPRVLPKHLAQLARSGTDFVVVDTRIAGKKAQLMDLFEDDYGYGVLHMSDLDKFDHTPGFTKVLDDGTVRIYDVRSVTGRPHTFVDRPSEGLPGDHDDLQMAWTLVLLCALLGLTWRRWRLSSEPWFDDGMVVVPAMIVLGAVGVGLHVEPVAGSVALTAVVALAVVRLRRLPVRVRPFSPHLGAAAALTALVAVAAGIAVHAELEHLVPHHLPPPPPAVAAQAAPGG